MIGALHVLVSDALASAVSANRVFVDLIPQDRLPIRAPLARYQVIDAVPAVSVCGDDELETSTFRVQIDVITPVDLGKDTHLTTSRSVISEMTDVEIAVLDSYIEAIDSETNSYRTRIDYLIGFSTTA